MALETYTPSVNKIVHTTGVDFSDRSTLFAPVHVVQYDNKLPIMAVEMYKDGETYVAPSDATASIRLGKKGHKFVMSPALGCNEERTILYFEITLQMVVDPGVLTPIVELSSEGGVAGSSYIQLMVDRNPIQDGDVESTNEAKQIVEYINQAYEYAHTASEAAKSVAGSTEKAETARVESEQNAKTASQAAKSASDSANSILGAVEASTQAKTDAEAAAKLAESYTKGHTGTRPDEDTDNAKYYMEYIKMTYGTITSALTPRGNIKFAALKALESPAVGDFYNVTEEFISDDDFVDGPDISYPAGSDVFYTADKKWNVVQGSGVFGIKGESETFYRKGQVEIKKEDLGLENVENKSSETILNELSAEKIASILGFTPTQFKVQQETLLPGKWQNEEFPFTYDISVENLTENQLVIIDSGGGLSKDQLEAFADAIIDKHSQETNKVVLQAVNKPEIELPIVLMIGGELA